MVSIKLKKLHPDAQIPRYETDGAAGLDVCSVEEKTIRPGTVALVSLGFSVAIPKGYEIQVRSRSGMSLKKSVFVLNSPGTVDSDYRGPMGVILMNLGNEPFKVNVGDRIAQIVVAAVARAAFGETETLDDTERGSGGFGSTGGYSEDSHK